MKKNNQNKFINNSTHFDIKILDSYTESWYDLGKECLEKGSFSEFKKDFFNHLDITYKAAERDIQDHCKNLIAEQENYEIEMKFRKKRIEKQMESDRIQKVNLEMIEWAKTLKN